MEARLYHLARAGLAIEYRTKKEQRLPLPTRRLPFLFRANRHPSPPPPPSSTFASPATAPSFPQEPRILHVRVYSKSGSTPLSLPPPPPPPLPPTTTHAPPAPSVATHGRRQRVFTHTRVIFLVLGRTPFSCCSALCGAIHILFSDGTQSVAYVETLLREEECAAIGGICNGSLMAAHVAS